ncbi:glycosyltransferase family 2 protein [Rhizobium sp. RU20A]|uniref:glycosyltransferase family 2 protein n=1 Tax=Rhizobium sp. RU20A TaxID=1907412 RepID=UPI00165EF6E7|nr:glycosyltransferase family 2 protein [Rhizobium sp. RU20A]
MKSVVLAQVRNPNAHLPAFLAHHLKLCDRVILLDHNSDVDLRRLRQPRVDVFRIEAARFAKDLFVAYFLKSLELWRDHDFLFLLDVDEFLPFSTRQETQAFMQEQRKTAVLSFHWRNGFSSAEGPLDGSETLRFTPWLTPTRKLVYNLKKTGDILPIEGNHNARYPLFDSLLVQIRPKRRDSGLGLFHLPFIGLAGLRDKLASFPEAEFRSKLMKDMRAVGIAEERAASLDLTDEDLMAFIANYRSEPGGIRPGITAADFEPVPLLAGLQDDIAAQADRLAACPPIATICDDGREAALIDRLRRNRVFFNRRLAKAFGPKPGGVYGFRT